MPTLNDYDPDCAEAAAELWAQLANHEGEDADAQIAICRALKEYACEHDKRITSDEWAMKYRDACEQIGRMYEALGFYAEPENYRLNDYPEGQRPIWADYGKLAQAAIDPTAQKSPIDGAMAILDERVRQQTRERYDAGHDDAHDRGELLAAAMCYASVPLLRLTYKPFEAESEITEVMAAKWPWDEADWKPDNDAIRNLAKAGALIAAEIDRLQRLQPKVW